MKVNSLIKGWMMRWFVLFLLGAIFPFVLSAEDSNISVGTHYTLTITAKGEVYAWGYNYYGQLGSGDTTNKDTPTKISGLSNIVSVSGGENHSLALTSDGEVYAWGYNGYGQLGSGDTTNKNTPTKISGLSNVISVSGGEYHSLALASDGKVYAWGYNGYGQLGNGNTNNVYTPTEITELSGVISISAGDNHSLALTSSGEVYGWGYNGYGQLGTGDTSNIYTPTKISELSDVVSVSAGKYHSLALTSTGDVYAWGYNGYGQLGTGDTSDKITPTKIAGLSNVVSISTGDYHSLALTSGGEAYAWGYNGYGQLGSGDSNNKYVPTKSLFNQYSVYDALKSKKVALSSYNTAKDNRNIDVVSIDGSGVATIDRYYINGELVSEGNSSYALVDYSHDESYFEKDSKRYWLYRSGGNLYFNTTATTQLLNVANEDNKQLVETFASATLDSEIVAPYGYRVEKLGEVNTQNGVSDMVLDGNYTYALSYSNIVVVDISNPQNPMQIATVDYYQNSEYRYRNNLIKNGNYLYASGYYSSTSGYKVFIEVIDVSNPSSPQIVKKHDLYEGSNSVNIFISGGYLYVADGNSNKLSLYPIDSSNNIGEIVGSKTLSEYPNTDIPMFKVGNFVYMSASGKLHKIDISDVNNPVVTKLNDDYGYGCYYKDGKVYSGYYGLTSYALNGETGAIAKIDEISLNDYDTPYMEIIGDILYISKGYDLYRVDISNGLELVEKKTFNSSIGGLAIKDNKLILAVGNDIEIYDTLGFDYDFDGIIDSVDAYPKDNSKWYVDNDNDGKVDSVLPEVGYGFYTSKNVGLDSDYFGLSTSLSNVIMGSALADLNLTGAATGQISTSDFNITDIYGNTGNDYYYWWYYTDVNLPYSQTTQPYGYELTATKNSVFALQFNYKGLEDKSLIDSYVFLTLNNLVTVGSDSKNKEEAQSVQTTTNATYTGDITADPDVDNSTVWFKAELNDPYSYYNNISEVDNFQKYRFVMDAKNLDKYNDELNATVTLTVYESKAQHFTQTSSLGEYAVKYESGDYATYYDKTGAGYGLNYSSEKGKYCYWTYEYDTNWYYTSKEVCINNDKFLAKGYYRDNYNSTFYVDENGVQRWVYFDSSKGQYYYYNYTNYTNTYIPLDVEELGSTTVNVDQLTNMLFVFNTRNNYYAKITADSNIDYLEYYLALVNDTNVYNDKVTLDNSGGGLVNVVMPESKAYKWVLGSEHKHSAKLYNFGSTEAKDLVAPLSNGVFNTNIDLGLKAGMYTLEMNGTANDVVTYIVNLSEQEIEQENNNLKELANSYSKKTAGSITDSTDEDFYGFSIGQSWYGDYDVTFTVNIASNDFNNSLTSDDNINVYLYNATDPIAITSGKLYTKNIVDGKLTKTFSAKSGVYYIRLKPSFSKYPTRYTLEVTGDYINPLPKTKLEDIYTKKYYEQLQGVTLALENVGTAEESGDSGSAIILAGIGDDKSDSLYVPTQKLVGEMYKKFKYRGFSDKDIYFINATTDIVDTNGDGVDDGIVDQKVASVANFLDAIKTIAKNQEKEGPLYIYMVDHGAQGAFKISGKDVDSDGQPEILYASKFDEALKEFETATGRKVIIIMEACNSGSFIKTLQNSNRVIVTSSADKELSFIDKSGNVSFTKYLGDELLSGRSIEKAYEYALVKLQKSGSIYANQNPKISGTDTDLLALSIGGSFAAAGMELTSIVDYEGNESNERQIDHLSKTAVNLSVSVNAGSTIKKVWATVIPPNYIPPSFADANFSTPDLTAYTVELSSVPKTNSYTGSFDLTNYKYNGVFDVTYYVEDSDGNVITQLVKFEATNGANLTNDDIIGDIGEVVQEETSSATLYLVPGWNLVSLPGAQTLYPDDINAKFGEGTNIWKYDGALGKWNLHTNNTSFAGSNDVVTLSSLNGGDGFWVKAVGDTYIEFNTTASYNILNDSRLTNAPNGWSLLGTSTTITPQQVATAQPSIKIIWKFANGGWYAYSPISNIQTMIQNSQNALPMNNIEYNSGFWILK